MAVCSILKTAFVSSFENVMHNSFMLSIRTGLHGARDRSIDGQKIMLRTFLLDMTNDCIYRYYEQTNKQLGLA